MLDSNWMVKGDRLEAYLEACRNADLACFKSNRVLTRIFEHSSQEQAMSYLSFVLRNHPMLFMNNFTNDDTGGANITRYGCFLFSPSTLQYIAVLAKLINHFGPLDDMRIVEIGGGYGGQYKTIHDVFHPACYHIIDLPEPCELQRRYAGTESMTEPTGQDYDLCISNYALSEITDNERYINEVLAKCKHGYITCNTDDMVILPWEHKRLPDISGEPNNYILIW